MAATTAATALAALDPQAAAGSDPLFDRELEPAALNLCAFEQRRGGDSRAVGLRVERDGALGTSDARDGDAGLRRHCRRHAIADGGDGESEHIESARHVGHRRWRERGCPRGRGRDAGGGRDAHRPLPATPTVEGSRFAATALAAAARGNTPLLWFVRAATVSRSPKTPAAVTAGPAPGPRTTSGRSR